MKQEITASVLVGDIRAALGIVTEAIPDSAFGSFEEVMQMRAAAFPVVIRELFDIEVTYDLDQP